VRDRNGARSCNKFVRFEVLTAVFMKIQFWDVTLCVQTSSL
jgi:hypothetical protein